MDAKYDLSGKAAAAGAKAKEGYAAAEAAAKPEGSGAAAGDTLGYGKN